MFYFMFSLVKISQRTCDFKRNHLQTSFIDKCFKKFLDLFLHIIKPTLATVRKKSLRLVLSYLGPIFLQVKTKIRNAVKGTLNCKLQFIVKSERKPSNIFRFKDRVLYDLVSGVVYEYTCGRCNSSYYGETERHLKVRSGEYVELLLLTFK